MQGICVLLQQSQHAKRIAQEAQQIRRQDLVMPINQAICNRILGSAQPQWPSSVAGTMQRHCQATIEELREARPPRTRRQKSKQILQQFSSQQLSQRSTYMSHSRSSAVKSCVSS
mmetsp:Transcript_116867/g.190260  ORF Transcript_116867/g.190260 Transcript_116867/m.190260 type:complete len:115 (-) Transcript_116867:139-483(-)